MFSTLILFFCMHQCTAVFTSLGNIPIDQPSPTSYATARGIFAYHDNNKVSSISNIQEDDGFHPDDEIIFWEGFPKDTLVEDGTDFSNNDEAAVEIPDVFEREGNIFGKYPPELHSEDDYSAADSVLVPIRGDGAFLPRYHEDPPSPGGSSIRDSLTLDLNLQDMKKPWASVFVGKDLKMGKDDDQDILDSIDISSPFEDFHFNEGFSEGFYFSDKSTWDMSMEDIKEIEAQNSKLSTAKKSASKSNSKLKTNEKTIVKSSLKKIKKEAKVAQRKEKLLNSKSISNLNQRKALKLPPKKDMSAAKLQGELESMILDYDAISDDFSKSLFLPSQSDSQSESFGSFADATSSPRKALDNSAGFFDAYDTESNAMNSILDGLSMNSKNTQRNREDSRNVKLKSMENFLNDWRKHDFDPVYDLATRRLQPVSRIGRPKKKPELQFRDILDSSKSHSADLQVPISQTSKKAVGRIEANSISQQRSKKVRIKELQNRYRLAGSKVPQSQKDVAKKPRKKHRILDKKKSSIDTSNSISKSDIQKTLNLMIPTEMEDNPHGNEFSQKYRTNAIPNLLPQFESFSQMDPERLALPDLNTLKSKKSSSSRSKVSFSPILPYPTGNNQNRYLDKLSVSQLSPGIEDIKPRNQLFLGSSVSGLKVQPALPLVPYVMPVSQRGNEPQNYQKMDIMKSLPINSSILPKTKDNSMDPQIVVAKTKAKTVTSDPFYIAMRDKIYRYLLEKLNSASGLKFKTIPWINIRPGDIVNWPIDLRMVRLSQFGAKSLMKLNDVYQKMYFSEDFIRRIKPGP